MNVLEKEYSDEEYEACLTEIYGTVKICGIAFDSGYALRELDPTAFDCTMFDMPTIYICGECDAEFEEDDKDEAEECCKEEKDFRDKLAKDE